MRGQQRRRLHVSYSNCVLRFATCLRCEIEVQRRGQELVDGTGVAEKRQWRNRKLLGQIRRRRGIFREQEHIGGRWRWVKIVFTLILQSCGFITNTIDNVNGCFSTSVSQRMSLNVFRKIKYYPSFIMVCHKLWNISIVFCCNTMVEKHRCRLLWTIFNGMIVYKLCVYNFFFNILLFFKAIHV